MFDNGSDESLEDSVPPQASQSQYEIAPQQRLLFEELNDRDPAIGAMYLGAIRVLADKGNPDRIPLAAHNVREMLAKLPVHLGVETKALREKMGDRVQLLYEIWLRVSRTYDAQNPKDWQGEINAVLRKFLVRCKEVFDWYEAHRPRRRAVMVQVLQRLDPAPVPMPSAITNLHVQEWLDYRDYFVALAHHDKAFTESEFSGRLFDLERFLLTRLRPSTFVEIAEIDEIIREGEANAKP